MSREATKRLLGMIEDGVLDRDAVINALLKFASEADVAEMCRVNDFFDLDEDEDEEEE